MSRLAHPGGQKLDGHRSSGAPGARRASRQEVGGKPEQKTFSFDRPGGQRRFSASHAFLP